MTKESDKQMSPAYPSSSSSSTTTSTGGSSLESVSSGGPNVPAVCTTAPVPVNQPLLSLKDYRKQTKTFRSGCGRRRSSMMPQKGVAPVRDRSGAVSTTTSTTTTTTAAATSAAGTANKQQMTGLQSINENEESARVSKALERIRELEEFIRQEDNSIRQTKDAIECCLSDPQFTGSAQHIECNRLLLISCTFHRL